MITKFKSLKYIIAKIYRDLGTNSEISENSIVEWAAEALSYIGVYGQYEEIPVCIPLIGGKGKLPCGFEHLVEIDYKGQPVYFSSDSNFYKYKSENCRIPVCHNSGCKYTFYINDSYIITNIMNDNSSDVGEVNIVYLGIRTDEDGWPLVPDNVVYDKAIASYVTKMLDYQDWRKGRIADKVFEHSDSEWNFYCSSARGTGNMPNLQKLEQLRNYLKRMIALPAYKTGFAGLDMPEQLNLM